MMNINFSAIEGEDFIFFPDSVTFVSGERAGDQHCITLTVLHDSMMEFQNSEVFVLNMSVNEDKIKPLVEISNQATIYIVDDDSKSSKLVRQKVSSRESGREAYLE